MDAFIKQVASKTGVDEAEAKGFIGNILGFIQKNASEDVTKEINAKLPAADQLISEASSASTEQQPTNDLLKPCMPVLELLKKLLAPLLGGSDTAAVTQIIAKSGVSPEQGAGMIQMLMDFLRDKVGPETVNKLTEQVPALLSIT